jgi:isopentenyl diphosphate isomerase/L-lactate dehydrogenase-like FMN-dependent dehydrogenase
MKLQSVAAAERMARRRLPRFLIEYKYNGGGNGWTNRENQRAFDEIQFRRSVALEFSHPPNLKTSVLGTEVSMPILIAPTGLTRLDHPEGDLALARAAGSAGTICAISHFSGHPIEEVAASGAGPKWQQLYWSFGREGADDVMRRAAESGYKALVVTVDLAWAPSLAFSMPKRSLRTAIEYGPQVVTRPRWLFRFARGLRFDPSRALRRIPGTFTMALSPSWRDLAWVRDRWAGKLVIKGIQSAEDARRAVDVGADAIVVSNHGGQFLDGIPSSISLLPRIVAAVNDDVEVLMDGGIRRGSDVAKAIAMGARAVLVGRAPLFGLALGGEEGVRQVLEILRRELELTLDFLGCQSIAALDGSFVTVPIQWTRDCQPSVSKSVAK